MQNFDFKKYFKKSLDEHIETIDTLLYIEDDISEAVTCMSSALKNNKKLIFCGNGGSAADSQHLAAEFIGRFTNDRTPLAALSLTTDTSILTCIANDYSFEDVFSRQVIALANNGDCLIVISTSGNSKNLITAVLSAKKIGVKTIGLLGRDGGLLRELCDINIIVKNQTTARIQEAHILIGHILCGSIEQQLNLV